MAALFQNFFSRLLLGVFALSLVFISPLMSHAASSKYLVSGARGIKDKSLTLEPQVLDFGNLISGQRYTKSVVLKNSSHSVVSILGVRRNNASFAFSSLRTPLRVGAGQSIEIRIAVVPSRGTKFATNFVFTTSTRQHLTLRAKGSRGLGGLAANPAQLNFGSVRTGWGQHLPLTIANTSTTNQTVTRLGTSNDQFKIAGMKLPMTLVPGESATFNVAFLPRTSGIANASLLVDSRDLTLSVPITGRALTPVSLGLLPTQLNFGNVTDGTSATLSGILQAGKSPVVIYSAGLTSAEFSLAGLKFPFTIAAGQSKSFSVTFSPAVSGATLAALSFRSTAGSSTETMAGTGVPKTSHRVTLSWNGSGSGVVGYNVYRATSSSGPYSQLNSVPDSNTSYLDTSIQSGHTYYYATTALASNGKQSAFSNRVQVTVP